MAFNGSFSQSTIWVLPEGSDELSDQNQLVQLSGFESFSCKQIQTNEKHSIALQYKVSTGPLKIKRKVIKHLINNTSYLPEESSV